MAPVTRRSTRSKPGASGNAATIAPPSFKHKSISPTSSYFSPDRVIESVEGPQAVPGDNTIGSRTVAGDFAILLDDSDAAASNSAHVRTTLHRFSPSSRKENSSPQSPGLPRTRPKLKVTVPGKKHGLHVPGTPRGIFSFTSPSPMPQGPLSPSPAISNASSPAVDDAPSLSASLLDDACPVRTSLKLKIRGILAANREYDERQAASALPNATTPTISTLTVSTPTSATRKRTSSQAATDDEDDTDSGIELFASKRAVKKAAKTLMKMHQADRMLAAASHAAASDADDAAAAAAQALMNVSQDAFAQPAFAQHDVPQRVAPRMAGSRKSATTKIASAKLKKRKVDHTPAPADDDDAMFDAGNDVADEDASDNGYDEHLVVPLMKRTDRILSLANPAHVRLIAAATKDGPEYYDSEASDAEGDAKGTGKPELFRNVKWGAYAKSFTPGEDFPTSPGFTQFVPGRFERMHDGTAADQKAKLVVKLTDKSGTKRIFTNPPPRDWNNQEAITALNKRTVQQIRRNTPVRFREVVQPYLPTERKWILANTTAGKPTHGWKRFVEDFNERFEGEVIAGAAGPRPARSHSSLTKEVERFGARYARGVVPVPKPVAAAAATKKAKAKK